ncbi:unnamed protein product [Prunus brigantina]
MALQSILKILNKKLGKWRDALAKAWDNIRSGQNLTDDSPMLGNCEELFDIQNHSLVALNETPLHDSPLDSPMDQDSPLPRAPRPIGRNAAKAKKGSTSNNECAQFLEQVAKNSALRLERDLKREEADKA